jgi:hypothetical protein
MKVRWSPDAEMEIPRRWGNCGKYAMARFLECCYLWERSARKRKMCWPIFGLIASLAGMAGPRSSRNSTGYALCKAGWRPWQRFAGWTGIPNEAAEPGQWANPILPTFILVD